jgi:hypothetical protein
VEMEMAKMHSKLQERWIWLMVKFEFIALSRLAKC